MSVPSVLYDAAALVPAGWWPYVPMLLLATVVCGSLAALVLAWRRCDRLVADARAEAKRRHGESLAALMARLLTAELRADRAESEGRAAGDAAAEARALLCDVGEEVAYWRGQREFLSTLSPCAPRRRRGHCQQGARR